MAVSLFCARNGAIVPHPLALYRVYTFFPQQVRHFFTLPPDSSLDLDRSAVEFRLGKHAQVTVRLSGGETQTRNHAQCVVLSFRPA